MPVHHHFNSRPVVFGRQCHVSQAPQTFP
ncbi:hypothetical protein RA210_U330017 [Rubrivivax sp. A210]|nr:hypothetical protein RA210_U330017 [Rubrivivax sp. A210]